MGGGGGVEGVGLGGVRVDVNEKLKFLGNWGVVRGGGRVGWWGGGVRVDVNAMLGVEGYCGVWGM